MQLGKKRIKMSLGRRRAIVGALGLVLALMLVVAACGEAATATPEPAMEEPEPTAMMEEATATAVPAGVVTATPEPEPAPPELRAMADWTADAPGTFEEIEAELANYSGQSLNVTSWGGAYQAAQRQAYFIPFAEKFNINLIEDSPVEYAKIRSMVETGNVTWDVVDSGTRAVYQLGPTGDLEEFTPAIHNRYLPFFPEVAITPWSGGGGVLWSTGLAYQKNKVDELWGGVAPTDWTALWDTENFPGSQVDGSQGEREHLLRSLQPYP